MPNNGEPKPKASDIAQAGAIAGAIFAALIAADPLNLQTRASWDKWIDYLAFILWVVTVVLFILTVADPEAWVLKNGRIRRHFAPGRVVVYAGVVTILALFLSVFKASADKDNVLVQLTKDARADIDHACGTRGRILFARLETGSLNNQFVTITLHLNPRSAKGCDQIRLHADQIVTLVEHPCHFPGQTIEAAKKCERRK
jgi:hypothetical protein